MKNFSGRARCAQAICTSTFGVALCATPVAAATLEVCETCDFTEIQLAIDAAVDGDVIEIAAGTYHQGSTLDTRGKVITLRGASNAAGDRLTIISGDVDDDGDGDIRILFCETPYPLVGAPEFVNLVFQNGAAGESDDGGGGGGGLGLLGGGTSGADDKDGGGAYILGNGPTFTNCHFLNNEAERNGGGIYYDATDLDHTAPVFRHCDFEGNDAGRSGGGIFNNVYGEQEISDCRFLSNTAAGESGGAIYNMCRYGNTRIERVEFIENSAAKEGGGLWSTSPANGGIQVTDCTFEGNQATNSNTNGDGGGMYFADRNECSNATVLLLDDDQLGDVLAGDTILVRVGVGEGGGSGLGSLKIAVVPRMSPTHELVFEDEDTGSFDAPIEIDDLGENTVIVPLEIESGGNHWVVGCTDVFDDPEDSNYEVSVDESPPGMWLQITIPEDFDALRQVIAVGSCTPTGLSDIFIAAYKQIGEVDEVLTYQRFAYVSDEGNNGCSNGGDYPNSLKSCLGSYILVNNSGTYTTPDGAEPVITGNFAENNGGGIYSSDCDIEVLGCSFVSNTSWVSGGGVYSKHTNYGAANIDEQWLVALPFPKLVGCTFSQNKAGVGGSGQGGGLYAEKQWSLYMADCAFDANEALGSSQYSNNGGGGLFAKGSTLRLSDCSFTNNQAVSDSGKMGGGMCNVGTEGLTMENCLFEGNRADGRAGGLYNTGTGLTTLTDCTFLGNQVEGAWGEGGGMYSAISGTEEAPVGVELENCTFRENQATGTNAEGGGLFHNGGGESILRATGCLFTENSAGSEGGGVRTPTSSSPAALDLLNTQVCGNTPDQISGEWTGNACTTEKVTCCPADFDGNESVEVNDLLEFLAVFGTHPDDTDCGVRFDLNRDGFISVDDLLLFLQDFGNACNGGTPLKVRPDAGSMSGRPGTASGS